MRSQWLGEAIWRGRTDTSEVALTFDDGPSDDTPELLEMLKRLNLSATFFMIGENVERRAGVARRVAEAGHEIGNHSYSHPIFLYRSPSEIRWQLRRTQEVIRQAAGIIPRFARPPCGVRTPAYFAAARDLNLRTIQWSDTGFDWKHQDAARIACEAVRRATAGSILLLHDGDSAGKADRKQTIAAVPLIIAELRSRNLNIVPLSRLLTIQSRQALVK